MRTRRYHSGVDISTNGGGGHEIYAIAGGYVERILVSTEGYGKTIYLRLKDRRIVVYAHLQRFAAEIDDYVRAVQQRRGQYSLDLRLRSTDFPVGQGDVLGYTGDTGTISGPHLHFEIRDPQNRPLNPLQYGLTVPDSANPVIKALALIPMSPESIVHGSRLTTVLPVVPAGDTSFSLPDTIAVKGPFGLATEAYDRVDGMRYNMTLHGLSLTIDSVRHYAIQFDRYNFREGQLMELERDFPLWRRDRADFHRLFTSHMTDSMSFVAPGSKGPIRLEPGYHTFEVKVWDQAHNSAVLRGVLASMPETQIAAEQTWSDSLDGWVISIRAGAPLRKYDAFFFDMRGRPVDSFSHRPDTAAATLRFLVPRQKGGNRIVQIVATDNWGARLEPIHVSLIPVEDVTRPRNFNLNIDHRDHCVVLQFSSDYYLPEPPELIFQRDTVYHRFQTVMVSPVDFVSPPLYFGQLAGVNEFILRVKLEPEYEVRLPFHGVVAIPDQRMQLADPSGDYRLEFRPGTFYDSTLVWTTASDAKPPPDGHFVIRPLEVGPYNRPTRNPMGIELTVPPYRLMPEHAGIFYLDRKNGWTFISPVGITFEDQIRTRAFRTKSTTAEVFALIEETDPPTIELKLPGDGGAYNSRDFKKVRFQVYDDLADIEDETAITLTIDKIPRIFEYNTFRDAVSYYLPGPLEPGTHEMIITAEDRLGNRTESRATFTIY